ncbi:DNA polymerase III subunit beta [Desulfosarcina ovata]|uniref:Beta sliding clamp n=1 Tax=Desulfosarcina ovata subsp. ovata TaxID=2752305 RepID=A0A5K8AET8_9BACT|nr:DNA polymerase III subunit beta [Desulfosarcina ovata]BBO90474.1 DNA polymerase III subunit beta [Desulfosarcina ovata subsp. ovata]
MKFTINKSQIVSVLAKIQGLAGRRSNLAITENILIRSGNEGVHLTATDLETGFEGFYGAVVDTEGAIAVSAKKLYEILREFPSDDIVINEIENRWIEIGSGKIQYHIVGMNPDDFPETPHITEVNFFPIDASVLEKMIERATIISAAGDEKRAHINGVFVERIKTEDICCFRFVSTDGSRLNSVDHQFDMSQTIDAGEGVLVPKKGLNEVAKFLDIEGDVQVGIKDSNFVVQKEAETIIIRMLEGEFPKYDDILKKGTVHLIELDKVKFSKMLKRMSILATDNYKGAVFNFDENKLVVTATNPDYGESKEEMEIEFSGDVIEAAFNPKFFLDTLSVIEDDNIILNIVDGNHPCIIEGDGDKTFTSVIMPMRI